MTTSRRREPELVGAVLRGCRRSYRHAAQNRGEWADFGARYFGITRDTMMRSIDRELADLHFDCEIDRPGMAAAIALQRQARRRDPLLALADIIDARFTPAAASSGGP